MNVKNCRKCGKLFNYVYGPVVCPACKEALEKKFQQVKSYIQQHGRATMEEVLRCRYSTDPAVDQTGKTAVCR